MFNFFRFYQGLIEAVKEILPYAEHRQCARHVYANLKKKYNGLELKNMFWGAAMSTIELDFQRHMTDIKNWFEAAYNHLLERDPQSWCQAFFKLHRGCEAVENGMCESFNKMILGNAIILFFTTYLLLLSFLCLILIETETHS